MRIVFVCFVKVNNLPTGCSHDQCARIHTVIYTFMRAIFAMKSTGYGVVF